VVERRQQIKGAGMVPGQALHPSAAGGGKRLEVSSIQNKKYDWREKSMGQLTSLITVQQKKIVWAIWKTKVRLEDAELYDFIHELFKKDHLSELTYYEGDLLINRLRTQTGEITVGKLTRQQRYRIEATQRELGWDDQEMAGFIKKQAGVEAINWLTPRQASKVITGLIQYQKWLKEKKHARV
jgi:hypothetical protein